MGADDELLGIIDELYASALDPTRLSAALGRIADVAGSSGGIIYGMRPATGHVTFAVRQNYELDPNSEALAEFRQFMPRLHRRTPFNTMEHVNNIWPIEDAVKSDFYNDILRPQEIYHAAVSRLSGDTCIDSIIQLHKSEKMGAFTDLNISMMNIIIPHLSRVLQLTNAIGAINLEREIYAATLDSLCVGVILTDERGKPIHLNRAAEAMIAGRDGLAIRAGRLAADMADDHRALERLVAQAAAGRRAEFFQRGGACRISRPSGASPWLVLVTPCGDAQARAIAPRAPACIILVRDPMRNLNDSFSQLRQVFALTAQEAKVALGVAEGRGLADVARNMGLSTLTVRNHLQRVFAKTGANRQAELTRLVTALEI